MGAVAVQRVFDVVRGGSGAPEPDAVLRSFLGRFGLYVHVPFCRSICPYCPYNKVLYRPGLVSGYFDALREELRLYGASGRRFTSLVTSSCRLPFGSPLLGILRPRKRNTSALRNVVSP